MWKDLVRERLLSLMLISFWSCHFHSSIYLFLLHFNFTFSLLKKNNKIETLCLLDAVIALSWLECHFKACLNEMITAPKLTSQPVAHSFFLCNLWKCAMKCKLVDPWGPFDVRTIKSVVFWYTCSAPIKVGPAIRRDIIFKYHHKRHLCGVSLKGFHV